MKRILLPLALAAAITVPVGAQFGWFSLNGGLIARMSSAVPAATIEQAGTGPILSLIRRGIGAVSTDGGVLRNTTAAAAGAQQYSPRSCWEGQGWKTDATAGSQSVVFCMETQPVQGTSAPSGNFVLKASINGGAFSTVGTFTSGGDFTAVAGVGGTTGNFSGVMSSASLGLASAGYIAWLNRGELRSPADGVVRVLNGANTNTYDITLADWGTTMSAESVSYADLEIKSIGTGGGTLFVYSTEDLQVCMAQVRGAGNGVRLTDSASGLCTVTSGSANAINIYGSGGVTNVENTRGSTRTLRISLIGG